MGASKGGLHSSCLGCIPIPLAATIAVSPKSLASTVLGCGHLRLHTIPPALGARDLRPNIHRIRLLGFWFLAFPLTGSRNARLVSGLDALNGIPATLSMSEGWRGIHTTMHTYFCPSALQIPALTSPKEPFPRASWMSYNSLMSATSTSPVSSATEFKCPAMGKPLEERGTRFSSLDGIVASSAVEDL